MFKVAEGFAFVGKRGMINEGEEITEKDFASKATFEKALKAKKIFESKGAGQVAADQVAKAIQKQKTAKEALERAKEAVVFLEKEFEKTNTANAGAEAKATAEAKLNSAKEALALAEKELEDTSVKLKALEGK